MKTRPMMLGSGGGGVVVALTIPGSVANSSVIVNNAGVVGGDAAFECNLGTGAVFFGSNVANLGVSGASYYRDGTTAFQVGLLAPTGLAASINLTLPTALPAGSNFPLIADATGQLSFFATSLSAMVAATTAAATAATNAQTAATAAQGDATTAISNVATAITAIGLINTYLAGGFTGAIQYLDWASSPHTINVAQGMVTSVV